MRFRGSNHSARADFFGETDKPVTFGHATAIAPRRSSAS